MGARALETDRKPEVRWFKISRRQESGSVRRSTDMERENVIGHGAGLRRWDELVVKKGNRVRDTVDFDGTR